MCKWEIQVFWCSRFLWQSLSDGKELKVWVSIRIWLLGNYDTNNWELFAWNCLNVVYYIFFIWKDFDLDGLSKNRMGFSLSVIITIPFGV